MSTFMGFILSGSHSTGTFFVEMLFACSLSGGSIFSDFSFMISVWAAGAGSGLEGRDTVWRKTLFVNQVSDDRVQCDQ